MPSSKGPCTLRVRQGVPLGVKGSMSSMYPLKGVCIHEYVYIYTYIYKHLFLCVLQGYSFGLALLASGG